MRPDRQGLDWGSDCPAHSEAFVPSNMGRAAAGRFKWQRRRAELRAGDGRRRPAAVIEDVHLESP